MSVLQRAAFAATLAAIIPNPGCNSSPTTSPIIEPKKEWRCPEDMVLIDKAGKQPFCINKTEISQEADRRFWEKMREERGFFVPFAFQKPEGNMAGRKKPAVLRNWMEARIFCQYQYEDFDGDLPRGDQWLEACGDQEYCTRSGKLNHTEAVYHVDGPADIGSTPANQNGVKDLTGNAGEWTKDNEDELGWKKIIRGGTWADWDPSSGDSPLQATFWSVARYDYRNNHIGFRCVASPKLVEETPKKNLEPQKSVPPTKMPSR